MNIDFWQGRRVFLTGHTGFKGSWLSLWLQSLGAGVWGYALSPPTIPSLFEVARVGEGMHSCLGDIRDLAGLQMAMQEAQPEVVIHMAAQSLVRISYTDPVETYAANVMGTVHLLEAVRTVPGVRVVIIVTSDKCYENREWIWGYRENEPMGGYDPYSSSKGCAELVTAAYRNSFFDPTERGVAIATARAGNVIGGGDWATDRLIPDFMRAIMAQQAVLIRSPKAIRPWQHVLEPLNGYLILAEFLWQQGADYAEGWNFGPLDDDASDVEWIVERLTRLWGDGATWRLDDRPQPHEANYLKLDISKARSRLGYQPRWRIEQALERIVAWYRAWQRRDDMYSFSMEEINAFMSAVPEADSY